MQKNFKKGLTIIGTSFLMILIKSNVAEANFTDTCIVGDLNFQAIMNAECANRAGQLTPTNIHLGEVISYDYNTGHLKWRQLRSQHNLLGTKCTERSLIYDTARNTTTLRASCPKSGNIHVESTLNLDEHIVNYDGTLVFVR